MLLHVIAYKKFLTLMYDYLRGRFFSFLLGESHEITTVSPGLYLRHSSPYEPFLYLKEYSVHSYLI